jgi:hypothetical protein
VPADYPAAVFTAMTRGALMSDATTQGTFVDKLQDEARAIEQTLGVNPQGAFATVKAAIEPSAWDGCHVPKLVGQPGWRQPDHAVPQGRRHG